MIRVGSLRDNVVTQPVRQYGDFTGNLMADAYTFTDKSPWGMVTYMLKQVAMTAVFILIVLFFWVVVFKQPLVVTKNTEHFEQSPAPLNEADERCGHFPSLFTDNKHG